MSVLIDTRSSQQIARYLDLSAEQSKLAAANMANIDTPGYRAVGIDFGREMQRELAGIDRGDEPQAASVRAVDGLVSRPDGNNVSLDKESLGLAEAQLRFKTGVALYRMEQQRLLDAIHADGK